MKKRQIAIILGLALAVSPVSAFAAEEDTEASSETVQMAEDMDGQEKTDIIVGEVKDTGEDEITVTLGKLPADEEAADASDEMPELELTDEEQTITVTEDTTILQVDWETAKESLDILSDESSPEAADEETQLLDAAELTLADIQEGDVLAVKLDEDGNADQIMVIQQS